MFTKNCIVLLVFLQPLNAFVTSSTISPITPTYRNDYKYLPQLHAFIKFNNNVKSWFDAKATCTAEGAELAVIRTDNEAEVIHNFLNELPSNRQVYIGLQDLLTEGEFETIDGVPASEVYHGWDVGEPNDSSGNEDCVVFQPNGKLNDGNCQSKEAFICKKDASSVQYNQACESFDAAYKPAMANQCIKVHINPKTWDEAHMICRAEQAHLAIINSVEEARVCEKELQKYPAQSLKGNFNKDIALIGFHDKFTENEFISVDGKPLSESGYEDWSPGQPDNLNEEDCGSIFRNGQLNDVGCNVRAIFICEKNFNDVLDVSLNSRIQS